MFKKIVEVDNGVKVIDESKNGDELFNTLEFGSLNAIDNDLEFKRPSIKTWMYTNITNRDVWMTEGFIPVKIPVNKDILIRLHKYEKTVVIIKTIDFKFKNKGEYSLIIKNLITEAKLYGGVRQDVINKLLMYKDGKIPYGINERIRLVYTIKESDLLDNKGVSIDGMVFSIDEPIGHAEDGEDIKTHYDINKDSEFNTDYRPNTTLDLTFVSYSGVDMTIDVLGKPLTLSNPIRDTDIEDLPHDRLYVSQTNKGKGKYISSYSRGELALAGRLITKEGEYTAEVTKMQSDLQKHAIDTLEAKFSASLQVDKFMLEHSVSLHKLFSYIIRDETAKLALEKEEVSTAKEFIKLLGSIK